MAIVVLIENEKVVVLCGSSSHKLVENASIDDVLVQEKCLLPIVQNVCFNIYPSICYCLIMENLGC